MKLPFTLTCIGITSLSLLVVAIVVAGSSLDKVKLDFGKDPWNR